MIVASPIDFDQEWTRFKPSTRRTEIVMSGRNLLSAAALLQVSSCPSSLLSLSLPQFAASSKLGFGNDNHMTVRNYPTERFLSQHVLLVAKLPSAFLQLIYYFLFLFFHYTAKWRVYEATQGDEEKTNEYRLVSPPCQFSNENNNPISVSFPFLLYANQVRAGVTIVNQCNLWIPGFYKLILWLRGGGGK